MTTLTSVLSSDQITSLIQQASTNFLAPATALQAQEKPIQTEISALGQVQSALSSLQSSLSEGADLQTLSQRTATSSSDSTVQVSATNDAAPGTYVLSNIQLAQSETLISSGFGSASGSIGAGSLTIQVGSNTAVTLNIGSGQDDLADIATAINQANTGVQASVLFDGSAYRLELTGATGAANAFTVSGTGGLAGLSYSSGVSGLTQIQAAGDAQFSLNGIAVTSGSNNVSGVLPGLSFTLEGNGSATVNVSADTTAVQKAADDVVSSLNNVLQTINQFASFDPTSGAGPLLGDINIQFLRTQLLAAISAPSASSVGSSGTYASLASIGFGITSGGAVTLDDSAFKAAAQADYGAVAALLANAGTTSNSQVAIEDAALPKPGRYTIAVTENDIGSIIGIVNGQTALGENGDLTVTGDGPAQGLKLHVAVGATGDLGTVNITQGLFGALSDITNAALASDGSGVQGESDNLNNSLTSMQQQVTLLQQQAQQQTLALTQQFSVAQATLSQLSTVNNFLSTYFAQLSNSSGG